MNEPIFNSEHHLQQDSSGYHQMSPTAWYSILSDKNIFRFGHVYDWLRQRLLKGFTPGDTMNMNSLQTTLFGSEWALKVVPS